MSLRRAAVSEIESSGVARLAADELANLVASAAPAENESDPRETAVQALIAIGDERWRQPVLSGRIPRGFATALRMTGTPMDDELLAVVRARLAGTDPIALVELLGSWGPAAASALPEVLAAFDRAAWVAPRALAAIAPQAPEVRQILVRHQDEWRAAQVLYELTGDVDPLLAAIDVRDAQVITVLTGVGEAARRVLPQLTELLTGEAAETFPARKAQIAAARVHWQLNRDIGAVLPTVAAVLRGGDISSVPAAEFAGELGDLSLAPLLRDLLDDQWATVAAARALWRLTGQAEVEHVLRVVRHGWPWPLDAVALLVEMRATTAVDALRDLAERDERVITSGLENGIMKEDDKLRANLYAAVEVLTAAGPA